MMTREVTTDRPGSWTSKDHKENNAKLSNSKWELQQMHWSGFHKKVFKERQDFLRLLMPHVFADTREGFPFQGLRGDLADQMIENCIGVLGLPLGLGVHFLVDGKPYVIPMATEEPSIVAAVSSGAKTLSKYGSGLHTEGHEKTIMEGTIRFINLPDEDRAEKTILDNKMAWMSRANDFCPSMVERGGGVIDIKVRRFRGSTGTSYFVVHIAIDVCQSMGSNCINRVVEHLAPLLQEALGGEVTMAVVSDLSLHCIVRAKFEIPVEDLSYKGVDGHLIAQKIIEANQWAEDDIFRAVTHNKGIMNGIGALALATGQDWRAIEASIHTYQMVTKGCYGPLTVYSIDSSEEGDSPRLKGMIELPIVVGTKGGVFSSNPCYTYALRLLDYPDSNQFSKIMASVGLVQNFAALRILVTEGIHKGHMGLHARNIANSVGTPSYAIPEVATYLKSVQHITKEAATTYLDAHELKREFRPSATRPKYLPELRTPNMLYFSSSRLRCDGKPIEIRIAFTNMLENAEPILISLVDGNENLDSVSKKVAKPPGESSLFPEHTVDWIVKKMKLVEAIALHMPRPSRANRTEKASLKTLSLLVNHLLRQLMYLYPKETREFVRRVLSQIDFHQRSLSLATWKPSLSLLQSHLGMGLMKTVPKDSTVFLSADDPENPSRNKEIVQSTMNTLRSDLLSGLYTKNPDLLLGFPLLIALWQVFELRAVQCIGKQQLASTVIEEQRQIANAIINYDPILDSTYDFVSFDEFMSSRMKHFQFTLFFLCDAMSLDETFVNDAFLKHLLRLGRYFEWEATLARDIHGFQHDKQPEAVKRTLNAFIFWLRRHGKELHEDSQQEFIDEMAKTSLKLHASELKGRACLSDLSSFQEAIGRIRFHYTNSEHEFR